MHEISDAVEVLIAAGTDKKKITVLHCNTQYPTELEDANLRAIQTIERELCIRVGYSDHTRGSVASIIAVSLGASVIEKTYNTQQFAGRTRSQSEYGTDRIYKVRTGNSRS